MKCTAHAALVMSSLAAFAQSAFAQTGTEVRMNFWCDASADAKTYFWYNHGSKDSVWRCRQAPQRSGPQAQHRPGGRAAEQGYGLTTQALPSRSAFLCRTALPGLQCSATAQTGRGAGLAP